MIDVSAGLRHSLTVTGEKQKIYSMGRRLYQNSKKKVIYALLVYILNTVVHIINTAVDIINTALDI